jgi:class 3 adenylate cyclase/tetratricopeptide (TPR) repeat protein
MGDMASWLDRHGLGKYLSILADNDVELDIVADITDDDLKEFGFSFGDRKRFLRAARERDESETTQTADTRPAEAAAPANRDAERRQLTVMFCDLVGSTALSAKLDPEDYRVVVSRFQSAATEAITQNGGFIARYMGDGVLTYFGYPAASENDPEQAVRGGLAIVEAVGALDIEPRLQVRVGIATGPVVVGDIIGEGASEEAAVLGETPNLAARLQSAAQPDMVLVAASTRALLGDRLEIQAMPKLSLKGIPGPVEAFRALRSRSTAEVSETKRDDYPLVGREVELALLERAWRIVCSGQSQAVLLTGEAGVGKSRLVRAFRERLPVDTAQITWYCSPYGKGTANFPFIEHLKRMLARPQFDNLEQLAQLERLCEELEVESARSRPLIARLLDIELPEPDTQQLPAEELKRRLQQLQVDLLRKTATRTPTVLIVEDLHWVDPTSTEVLGQAIDELANEPVMLLMTARPEFTCQWLEYSHCLQHSLSHLSREDTLALVRSIIVDRGLGEDVAKHVLERTDGVPLYVEELTKTLLESADDVGIPASLQDSLMARLDRLGSTKELAQIASVIGRDFAEDALAELAGITRADVQQGLTSLIDAGLVLRRRARRDGTYEFKHALIRDAAHESLLKERRRSLHARYAYSLGDDSSAELKAVHFTEAGLWDDGASCWHSAGIEAVAKSAHLEAVQHFRNAAACLARLGVEHAPSALRCSINLAFAYRNLGQPRDVIQTLDGCEEQLAQYGDAFARAQAHYLRGVAHFVLGDEKRTYEEESAALVAAREANSDELEARALSSLGDWAYATGQVRTAHDYQKQCAAIAERHNLTTVEIDNLTCFEATRRCIQGTTDASAAENWVERAASASLLRAESILCAGAAWTFAHRNELNKSLDYAQRGVRAAETAGSELWRVYCRSAESRTLTLMGRASEGRSIAEECVEGARRGGSAIVGGLCFGALALATVQPTELAAVLEEGETQLGSGDAAHCHLDFYRDAIDACLNHGRWDEVDRYAMRLRAFTAKEPIEPAEMLASRGEALAALGRGDVTAELISQVKQIQQLSDALGMYYFSERLSAAYAQASSA